MSSCRYRCRSRLLLNWPWLTWRAPRVWRPLPASLAGGAGARPAHPISGHKRSAFAAMHAPDVLYVVHDCWLSGKPMKRREFIWLLGGAALVPDSKGCTLRQKFFDVIHIAA